jgi:hypothetical protein
MVNRLAAGLARLNDKLTANASTPWTYTRGPSSCTVSLTEETQKLRVTDGRGNTKIERPQLAGTFSADELDFGDGAVEPEAGDTLSRAFGSVVKTYRLMPQNNGSEPAWHYCDPGQNRVRVFGKLISSVT